MYIFIIINNDQFLKFFAMLRNQQEIVIQICEIYLDNALFNSHKKVLISCEHITKEVEDLKITK
jgi:hypothetical protein